RLLVEVVDAAGKVLENDSRSFRYEFIDAAGNPQPLNGATAPIAGVRDTTIPPRESRLEKFAFRGLAAGAKVRAFLEYSLVPAYRRTLYPSDVFDRHFRPTRIAVAELRIPERTSAVEPGAAAGSTP
ncbi:MAG: hypothetical protein ACREQ9_22430, partial [Candidatus Binatia bacterium]